MKKINFNQIIENETISFFFNLLEETQISTFLVGGIVRDWIKYKKVSSDIDFSTMHDISKILPLITKLQNFHILKNALNYNAITLVNKKYEITITSLREDVKSYGRQSDIKPTKDIEKDASRRDFTINALYLDKNGRIYDFFNGLKDLEGNKVIFIGEPKKRIQEDYLRIIRFFRFSALLTINYDPEYLIIIKKEKEGLLKHVSKERVTKELNKLLNLPYAKNALEKIEETGILFLLTQKAINAKEIYLYLQNVLTHKIEISLVLTLIMPSLFIENISIAEILNNHFIITKQDAKIIKTIYNLKHIIQKKHSLTIEDKIMMSDQIKQTTAMNLIKIITQNNDLINFINTYKEMPFSGSDVKKYLPNIEPQKIGNIIKKIKTKWIENNQELNKEELIKLLTT